jgi:uncharacterized membrane protein
MRFGGHALRWLPLLVCQGLAIVAAALLLALPFLLNFTPFGSELRWTEHTTPLWQLLALYAHILPGCLAAFFLAVRSPRGSAPALFACILALMAALLIVLPEIAYVKDIYGDDFARANTMFKLTFRAQPLGVMAAIVASGILLIRWEGTRLTFVPYLLLVPLLLTLTYPSHWLWPRLVDTPFDKYTLGGLGYVTREAPDDMAFFPLIRRLRLKEGETILEADGDSYTYAGRFSAMTGRPTALGWQNHEWLWRGNYDAVSSKAALVEGVYESKSPFELCKALKTLRVAYVIVGDFERKRYARLNIQPLLDVADITAKAGATSLYQIRRGACGDS